MVTLPYDDWWRVLVEGRYAGADGLFVHPVDDARVMAGNGTIGLELLEDLPDLDAVVVPYGGGGLLTGIASAVKAQRPDVRFYSAEPETGAPASRAFADRRAHGGRLRPLVGRRRRKPLTDSDVWQHASELLDGAFAVSLDETAAAVRLIAERVRVIAEGAGALAAAANRARREGKVVCIVSAERRPVSRSGGNVVCIVSGGNIDPLGCACGSRRQARRRDGDTRVMTTVAYDVAAARARFSSLRSGFAFFDAPGGTQVPDEVGEAIAAALREASGNLGAPYPTGRAVEDDPRRGEGGRGRVPRLQRRPRSRSA